MRKSRFNEDQMVKILRSQRRGPHRCRDQRSWVRRAARVQAPCVNWLDPLSAASLPAVSLIVRTVRTSPCLRPSVIWIRVPTADRL